MASASFVLFVLLVCFPLHFASWRPIGLCTGPPSALLLRSITMLELMEHVACQASVWIRPSDSQEATGGKKAATF